jgi:short-subunit dehydrogenase
MKYVFITEASSGIGYEFARSYAKLGRSLILVARSKDKLRASLKTTVFKAYFPQNSFFPTIHSTH